MSTLAAELNPNSRRRAEIGASTAHAYYNSQLLSGETPSLAARGIIFAVMLAIPFWALFGFAIYLLT